MTCLDGEYRVRQHPTLDGRILVSWRRDDHSAIWAWVAVVDNPREASDAMVAHQHEVDQ